MLSRHRQFCYIHKEYNIYKDIAEVIIEKDIIGTTFDTSNHEKDRPLPKGK